MKGQEEVNERWVDQVERACLGEKRKGLIRKWERMILVEEQERFLATCRLMQISSTIFFKDAKIDLHWF